MKDIQPNSPPITGAIAISFFNGIKHIAYVEGVTDAGVVVSECNMRLRYGESCGVSERPLGEFSGFMRL